MKKKLNPPKFKAGDKVITRQRRQHFTKGEVGVVVNEFIPGLYIIKFERTSKRRLNCTYGDKSFKGNYGVACYYDIELEVKCNE